MKNLFNAIKSEQNFFESNSNLEALFEKINLATAEGELFIGSSKVKELFLSIQNPLDFYQALSRTLFLGYSFNKKIDGIYDMLSFPQEYRKIIEQYTASTVYDGYRGNTFLLGAATLIGYTQFLMKPNKDVKLVKNFYKNLLNQSFNLFSCNQELNYATHGIEYHTAETFDANARLIGQLVFFLVAKCSIEKDKNSTDVKNIILNYFLGSFTQGKEWMSYKKSVFTFNLSMQDNSGGVPQNLKSMAQFFKQEKISLTLDDEKKIIYLILKAMTDKSYEYDKEKNNSLSEKFWDSVWVTLIKDVGLSGKAIAYVSKAIVDKEFEGLTQSRRDTILSLVEWISLGDTINTGPVSQSSVNTANTTQAKQNKNLKI